jgi:outer membrane protein|tara:strand:- start:1104 stop:2414 length:1311 start_codon:yes stop_codon:yes gene_type:complete
MNRSFCLACIAWFVLAVPVTAQEGFMLGPKAVEVTLEDAIQRAVMVSPQIAQAEQRVVNAGESKRTAVGSFLPTISTGSGMSVRSSDRFDSNTDRMVSGSSNSYNASINARYNLFQGGQRFSELSRVKADYVAAEALRKDQDFNVIFQTKNLFFEALRQQELREVARLRIEQATQSLEMTRMRQQLGGGTVSDTLRARLELINARQALLTAENATQIARFGLGRQIGMSEPVAPVVPEDLNPAPLGLEQIEVLRIAESESPSVVAANATLNAAEQAYSSAKASYLPTFSLNSGYNWSNQQASFDQGMTSWNLNFNMSYPLFNGFSREASVVRAESSAYVARLQEDDARRGARQEADAALRFLATSELAIDIAEEAVQVANEDLRVTRERYRVGVAIILDVVTSQIAVDQARVDLVNARYNYVLARAELEAILGMEF